MNVYACMMNELRYDLVKYNALNISISKRAFVMVSRNRKPPRTYRSNNQSTEKESAKSTPTKQPSTADNPHSSPL